MKRVLQHAILTPAILSVCLLGYAALGLPTDAATGSNHYLLTGQPAQIRRTFAVSGKVTFSGKGLPEVTMRLERAVGTGTLPASLTTDAQGNWTGAGFETGTSYRVTPSLVGFNFRPGFIEFSGTRTDLNFTALPLNFDASGSVRLAGGSSISGGKPPGIEGVEIAFERVSPRGLLPGPARTDANGQWRQSGFLPNVRYLIT